MLHFVIGRAKSGKTTHAFETAKRLSQKGERSIYLTPEQFSYESERTLFFDYQNCGGLCTALSFTSLCREIFIRYGGMAEKDIDTVGKNVLMSVAFDSVKDQLKLFGSQNLTATLLRDLCDAKDRCDSMGLTSLQMDNLCEAFYGDSLADKLHDFNLLFSAFDLLVQKNYGENSNPLLRAAKFSDDFFADKILLVDGFDNFYSAQLTLLTSALKCCKDVYIYLNCEDIYSTDASPFFESGKTARMLLQLARTNGVKVAPITALKSSYFKASPAKALEEHLAGKSVDSAKGLQIWGAPDIFTEMTAIAVNIRKKAAQGVRYRDMALIVRDVDLYKTAIKQAFDLYEIPYFLDVQEDIFTKPTMQFFTLVLTLAVKGFTAADLLQLAYITHPKDEACFALENYLFKWKIDGAALSRPFVHNPAGFGAFTEEDTAALQQLNAMREKLVFPLQKLRDAAKKATGEKIVAALYDVYTSFDMNSVLKGQIENLLSLGEEEAADKQIDQQNTAIQTLDTLYTALSGVPMSLTRFYDIFRLTADSARYATPPQKIDEVLVADAAGSIVGDVDYVYAAGLSFGVFPAITQSGGLLSTKDFDKLYRAGVELSQDYGQCASNELANVYRALTRAGRETVLSYFDNNKEGAFIGPGEVISGVQILPDVANHRYEELSEFDFCISQEAAFRLLCTKTNDERTLSLQSALDPVFQSRYSSVQNAPACYRYELSEQGASLLFPIRQTMSPSRLEQYLQCPFSFFLQSGLGLQQRREGEISPTETGTFVHYILEQVITRYKDSMGEIDALQLHTAVEEAAADFIGSGFGNDNLSPRQNALLRRITQNCQLLMLRIWQELKQSEFVPSYFELKIGRGGVDPMVVKTPGGRELSVIGTVDRVDLCKIGDETFVRVVDYKTGTKQFSLEDVYEGRNMQMLIYLFTLQQAGFGREAGVLYMPSFVAFGDTEPDGEVNLQSNGLLLNDTRVLTAMEKDLEGKYIFVKEKNGKLSGEKYLATPHQFELLKKHTQNILGGVADKLGQGEIDASPISHGQFVHCDFCGFKSVCGHESTDDYREPFKFENGQTIYDILEQEEQ